MSQEKPFAGSVEEAEGSSSSSKVSTSWRPAQDAVRIERPATTAGPTQVHRFDFSTHSSNRPRIAVQTASPAETGVKIHTGRAGVEKHHFHPSSRPPSSTSNLRSTDLGNNGSPSSQLLSPVEDSSLAFITNSSIPKTPILESSSIRRRLSSPSVAGPSTVRPRKKTLEQARSPILNDYRRAILGSDLAEEPSSSGWVAGSLLHAPLVEGRLNKSDDEREVDDERRKPARQRKRRTWWGTRDSTGVGGTATTRSPPLISMTPPSTYPETGFIGLPLPVPPNLSPPQPSSWSTFATNPSLILPSLTPLPQDPNNILPLSSPMPSPPVSRYHTPYHTPHASMHDLSAEYNVDIAGPSGSSASARTSSSASSSRYGWTGVAARSDSHSSAEEDDSPVSAQGSSWWSRHDDLPVSPKLLHPHNAPSRIIRIGSSSTLVPTGTRKWGWLLGLISRTLSLRSGEMGPAGSPLRRQRHRERERLISRHPVRKAPSDSVWGSKWLARVMVFVPQSPWSIFLFLVSFAIFAATLTCALKIILNPDKEALPWRSYCASDFPTLYSLQDPTVQNPLPFAIESTITFTSPPVQKPLAVNSFASASPANLVLTPLTVQHPAWPYHPHAVQPFVANTSTSLDHLEPVGVLVGVFTTDEGVQRRHMIRQSYASHWRSRREGTEGVSIRFVMGRPRRRYAKAVQLEMEAFHDIILLDIPENMNSGKTHAFFSWAAENATVPHWEYPAFQHLGEGHQNETLNSPVWRGEKTPAYVVKADEDSFIMLGELERHLRVAPRTKAYWGYLVKNLFMAGECYGLSFDLVRYIAASPALKTLTHGKEDKLVSRWMRMHPEREEIVWVAERCWIYDHPKAGTVYSHGFLFPSTIAEIRKEHTAGLPPSAIDARGGPEAVDAYSSVSKFGKTYQPVTKDLSAIEQVEALIEGSPLSSLSIDAVQLGKAQHRTRITAETIRRDVSQTFSARPTRSVRFLGDPQERGGTVVVHYIKKPDWFVETMIAFLGTADEQDEGHHVTASESGARIVGERLLDGAQSAIEIT